MARSPALLAVALVLSACEADRRPEEPAPGAGKLVAEARSGPVGATLRMLPEEPRFGERVRFALDVVAGEGAVLEPPEISARFGHFRIRGHAREGIADDRHLSYSITAEPEKTGTNICRPPPIAFRVTSGEGAGTERELVLEPFEVEVAGLSPERQPELADLGIPLAPVALPIGHDRDLGVRILAAAALVVLVAGALWWRRRRRLNRDRVPYQSPSEQAAWAFDALLTWDLIEQGRFAEFYVKLTGIVRRYVERTTGICAPEQTTEEFLREMEGNESFGSEQRLRLSEFLSSSDLIKFAAQIPSREEIEDAIQRARSFCGLEPKRPEVAA
jgi:hypothetical protein